MYIQNAQDNSQRQQWTQFAVHFIFTTKMITGINTTSGLRSEPIMCLLKLLSCLSLLRDSSLWKHNKSVSYICVYVFACVSYYYIIFLTELSSFLR